ncbi:MAG: hypothetical protein J2P37_05215, partial [Ktedonobacteraceae bacterium]|nr:hypothetical protein [Ktedonobacteraceae bacterium]
LVKLAAAPLLALYLVLLARRAYSTAEAPLGQRLKKVALTVTSAGLMSGVTALVLYLPYWQGWTLEQILFTFTSTPASQSSNGSILYAIVVWNREHPLPEIGSWVYYLLTIFGQHRTWNIINAVTMGGALLVGAIWIWRSASTRTLALAGLATLGTVLIVTSWFYPWYITWIAGLAVIVLPVEGQRVARMWLAFTLVFSASAFGVYLYANYLSPLGGWNWASCIVVLLPPLLTLLLFRLLPASGVSNE